MLHMQSIECIRSLQQEEEYNGEECRKQVNASYKYKYLKWEFTMKVLKKGRSQRGWAKEHTCTGGGNGGGGCGAVLLVEESDLFRTESHALHETEAYVTFKCCECGVLTDTKQYPKGAHSLPYGKPLSERS